MKCYYHNDADGRCAGAIVNKRNQLYNESYDFIEVDYKDIIQVDQIKEDEDIIIVDFSFKPKIMKEVFKKTTNIIWIDHHETAFEYDYRRELKGLRDVAYSGCELAWQYFFHGEMPRSVILIGDRDKHALKYGKETDWFNIGLLSVKHQPKDLIWNNLLNDNIKILQDIIDAGKICEKFRDNFCKDYADKYGFETEFEGHKAFALGIYRFSSEAFGKRYKEYPLCLSFVYSGEKWSVSLYSEDIDVSKIAKKYGGGGHKGAAGFVCNQLPFCKLEIEK